MMKRLMVLVLTLCLVLSSSVIAPAALTGACLVMAADLIGQFAFDTKFPVGVITGILGAPYLIYLLTRTARRGGSA